MRACVFFLAVWPGLAMAEDWVRVLTDEEITDTLAGRSVQYDPLTLQHFGRFGDTQFITERMADGRWAARGGQYCSVWPPSDLWACYDLEVSGNRVRFTGSDRSVSEGVFVE